MRRLIRTIDAVATNDGDGVKINRIAGRHLNSVLDPFLLVDEINSDDASDYSGGFPEHPHRGFETITYMKAGRMHHRDHMGNEGIIESGDAQWMTAGRGVLHSEMPEQESGQLHGFQVWLNLPASEKMKPAAYRDFRSANITELNLSGGGRVRVIAGEVEVESKKLMGVLPTLTTEPVVLDVQLGPSESVDLIFKSENPAFAYIYDGLINENTSDEIKLHQVAIFSNGDRLQLQAGLSGANVLVLSGRPLNEPIVQHGPFVMNSSEEIEQAINDYQQQQLV